MQGASLAWVLACECDRCDHLARLDAGGHLGDEEVVGRHPTFAGGTREHQLGIQRERNSRQLGQRVAVGQAAADGATVARRGQPHVGECCGQQRALGLNQRAGLGIDLAHERTDDEAVAGEPDVVELVAAVDRHEHLGPGQPEIHERHQALAAGEDAGVVAVFGEGSDHLVERLGGDERERGRLHGDSAHDGLQLGREGHQ